jgi:CSLREA domain-containing protein
MRRFRRCALHFGSAVALLAGILVVGMPMAGAAPPFTVNSTLDEHDAATDGNCVSTPSGKCTLRAAIEEINNLALSGNIGVPAGNYVLSLGDIDITRSPTISGAGAGSTIISGGGTARVFETMLGAFAYMEKMTIRNGVGGTSTVFPGHIHGGAIHNHGTLILVDSTVRDSTAATGGGITNAGTGVLTLVNDTITGNTATAGGGGGLENLGAATVDNVTISGNTGASAGGLFTTQSIRMNNTIVANNAPANCSPITGVAVEAALSGNNLDSGNSCGFTATADLINTDPLLGALASDGTLPLSTGSAAIDAGDSTPVNCPTHDERGATRPQDGNGDGTAKCDIGAYEKAAPPPPPPPPTPMCDGRTATIVGTAATDTINGTAGADVIVGLGGNDKIYGRGGADRICGGSGKDLLVGGTGADRLFGGPGNDTLRGGPGDDLLNGGPNHDSCSGGPGSDRKVSCEE